MIRCQKCGYESENIRAEDCPLHEVREQTRAKTLEHSRRVSASRKRRFVFALRVTLSERNMVSRVAARMGVDRSEALRILIARADQEGSTK